MKEEGEANSLPTPHLIYSTTAQTNLEPLQRSTMTVPTLPEELLTLILSALHQNDLYHSALASKTFCAITQPLLYSCVTIKAKSQIEQLKAATNDDKSRIERVTFVAEDNITSHGDFDALMVVFRTETAAILDRIKEGCVGELFAGVVVRLDCASFLSSSILEGHTDPALDLKPSRRCLFKALSRILMLCSQVSRWLRQSQRTSSNFRSAITEEANRFGTRF